MWLAVEYLPKEANKCHRIFLFFIQDLKKQLQQQQHHKKPHRFKTQGAVLSSDKNILYRVTVD